MKTALIAAAFGAASVMLGDDILRQQDLVFNPGALAPGTATTWTFRTSTENGTARLLIDSEGTDSGAAPDGYAELQVRSQDELRNSARSVTSSSSISGRMRVMSHSFGYTDDPKRGACRGTQCPDMTEIYSDRDLRLTAGGEGVFDVVVGSTIRPDGSAAIGQRLRIDKGGVTLPEHRAQPRRRNFACFDDTGKVISRPRPCNQ